MTSSSTFQPSWKIILPPAFLVAGNVLGVGLLALPIKVGLSGYFPSVLDVLVICFAMVVSALVIAARLPTEKKIFDIPSFFHQELGLTGRLIAIICNLIILYGIITAYLSGISSIIHSLIPYPIPKSVIIVSYFILATSLVIFGNSVLKKSSTILLFAIWICFGILIVTGFKKFNIHLLTYTNWKFIPLGLPVAISAFHFHNVIPTVSSCVDHNHKALRKVIFIGIAIGLVMNLVWLSTVLGTLPHISIKDSFLRGVPATIPMSNLLGSHLFTIAGLIFASLAVTASYAANGSGLFGFIRDLLFSYFKTENIFLGGCLAFFPPLIIALVYPNIFLAALDIVGGIGEAMLFGVLPGLILIRMMRHKSKAVAGVGYFIFILCAFIMLFVAGEKFGLINPVV